MPRAETRAEEPRLTHRPTAPPARSARLPLGPGAGAGALMWVMAAVPVILAILSVALLLHLGGAAPQLLEQGVLAGRLRALTIHVRAQVQRMVTRQPIDRVTLRTDLNDFDAFLADFARMSDDDKPQARSSALPMDEPERRLREQWGTVSGALHDLESPGCTAADSAAALVTLRAFGPEFVRVADALAADLEKRFRQIDADHHRRITGLLAMFLASLVAGAAVKVVDTRLLVRHQSDLERLSLIAESTGNSVVLAGPDGRALWANDAFLRTAGWEAVEGRSVAELLGADPGTLAHAAIHRAIEQREAHVGEHELRRRDGRPFWAAIELAPARGASGGGRDLMLMFTDITPRVRAARDLFASEARFRSALAAMSEGFVVFEAGETVVQCNAAALRIVGLPEAEMLGRRLREHFGRCVHEDGSPYPVEDFPVVVTHRTGRPLRGVVVGLDRRPDDRVWISIDTSPFVLPGEGGHGVVATLTDVTARHQAERSLRVLTRVVEESPTMVLIAGCDDRIEYVNPAFEARTGYAMHELRGSAPRETMSDQTPPETLDSLVEALKHGADWRGEIHNVARDGTVWLADSQVFSLHGRNGEITHHVALLRDITEARRHEHELHAAREAAVAAARAKNEFLQNVSHELRTPLNGIMGMSELLLQSGLEPGQRADLLQLRHSAEELLDVVTHLFDFARIEAGESPGDATPFRLRSALDEVAGALAAGAEARGLSWSIDVEPAVPDALVGDPGMLRRALASLASNAVKFTEVGEVRLAVSSADVTDVSATLRFEMRDTGIGIPSERQAEIFEAFSQLDGSSTRRYGGVGLGLALASRLVRRMGGQLSVDSEPGHGSRFSFTLSLLRAGEGMVPPQEPAMARPLAGARVLVLVGRPPGRASLRAALGRAGAEVTEASPGVDAADRLSQAAVADRAFRAVVLDVRDGAFDGFHAFTTLGTPGDTKPPALLFTSAGQRGDAERCRELGIAGYLSAPAGDSDLVEALRYLGTPATAGATPALVTRHLLREERARRRVLLVDDNAVNRKVATRLLERLGYDVTTASDGEDAVRSFMRGRFDAVLMDVQMPDMDGLEATRRIRAHEARHSAPRTPVLALTAHTLDADRAAAIASGMDELLPKPIQPQELAATLQRFLSDAPANAGVGPGDFPLSDVIGWDDALSRLDGDEALVHELLDIFEADAASLQRAFDEAVRGCDAVRLQRASHSLRGASETISASRLARLAGEVEQLARNGRIDEARAQAVATRAELQRLLRAVRSRTRRRAA